MYAMGNVDFADSQTQAALTLQVSCSGSCDVIDHVTI